MALLVGSLLWATTSRAQQAEAFYDGLLEQGIAAHGRGDLEDAATRLRVACFGLLERPAALSRCWVHLALVQDESGNQSEAQQALERLMEIERRIAGYAEAELPDGVREDFEILLARRIDTARLQGLPVFAGLLRRQEVEALDRLPLKARREETIRWSREVLNRDPGNLEASCRLRDAAAGIARCEEVTTSFSSCPSAPSDPKLAQQILHCLIDGQSWSHARELLAELPPTLLGERRIQHLAKKIPGG